MLRDVRTQFGVVLDGWDARNLSASDSAELKRLVYEEKLVTLRGQSLSPAEFVAFGRMLGKIETYYEPMYHHPEYSEIFVSSNVSDGKQIGVPQTGKFWHSDYQFMSNPFALTAVFPQVLPTKERGTYFIDMGRAYAALPENLRAVIEGTCAMQSPRRYFKVREIDVYKPIFQLLEEIEYKTPPVCHPTMFKHPYTGEKILYISEAFTYALIDTDGATLDAAILGDLLKETGQIDPTFTHDNIYLHSYDLGDLVVWDNRSLVHCALHSKVAESTVSYRVTMHDAYPFYEGISVAH